MRRDWGKGSRKKVIDGAVYNPDTAALLGEWSTDLGPSDLGYLCEDLHRTKAGKYFIHGEGGAMTKYATSHGNNNWGYGWAITPLTPMAAMEWAEKHLTADEYATIFGEPDEASDDKEALKIYIAVGIKARLNRLKEETGKSISQLIEEKFTE